jgi:hypothetical protein
MSEAIPVNRKRGRPKVGATLVGVRIEPDLLEAVDRFASEHDAKSRPDAVRLLLSDHLIGLGYLKIE